MAYTSAGGFKVGDPLMCWFRSLSHRWPLLVLALHVLLGSAIAPLAEGISSPAIVAEPWPAADQIFKKDHRWLGGDGASSIDLGEGRVLWLFGDSFIATTNRHLRSESLLIRNSIAIQSGYDPESAAIRFHWRFKNNIPQSFFPEDGPTWFWPGQGIVTNGFLLIFILQIHPSDNDLGFEFAGWKALRVFNYKDEPSKWKLCWADTPPDPHFIITGAGSVLLVNGYLYAFCSDESATHDVYLARWAIEELVRGDLKNPRWWTGHPKEWCEQRKLRNRPAAIFTNGQAEFTVHYEPRLGRFVQIQTSGFGSADIAFRVAKNLVGPWSTLEGFYRPREYGVKGILLYAGKAHPELVGYDMIITYAVSHTDADRILNDGSIYYPRFLRCKITNETLPRLLSSPGGM
jgi:hypothetical protein